MLESANDSWQLACKQTWNIFTLLLLLFLRKVFLSHKNLIKHNPCLNLRAAYLLRRGVFVVKKLIYCAINIKSELSVKVCHCRRLHLLSKLSTRSNVQSFFTAYSTQYPESKQPQVVAMFTDPWKLRKLPHDVTIIWKY